MATQDPHIVLYPIHHFNPSRFETAIVSSPFHHGQTRPHNATSPVSPLPHHSQLIPP